MPTTSVLTRAAGVALLTLLTTTVALDGVAASAVTTARYVATDGNDRLASAAPNDCSSEADPCATIGHAVDEAAAGDTIDIGPGTFSENLTVQKSLTLDGSGSKGTGSTIIAGAGAGAGAGSVSVSVASDGPAVDVTVKDVAISGNSSGSGLDAAGTVTVHLLSCAVSHNSGGDGIDVHSGAVVNLSNSHAEYNRTDGIRASSAKVLLDGSGASHNGLDGIQLATTDSSVTVTDSDVDSNTFDGIQLIPLTQEPLGDTGPVLTLTGSSASRNGQSGIDVFAGPGDTSASPDAGDAMKVSDSDVSDNGMSGVFSNQNLSLSGSTVNRNADNGLSLSGSAAIDHSTFDQNSGSGIRSQGAQLRVSASTISRTGAIEVDGGFFSGGGIGVFAGGSLVLRDSTLVANSGQGVLTDGGTSAIESSTISGTTSSLDADYAAGGVVVGALTPRVEPGTARRDARKTAAAADGSSVTVTSSIVASQSVAGIPDCIGDVTDGGYNLSSDADNSCGFGQASHDLVRADPELGALADNGGPTKTQLIGKGSPAVDVISAGVAACGADAVDQRGVSRPQGGRCDIGAVEARQTPLTITPGSLPRGTVGRPYSATLRATGGLGAPYAFSLDPGTRPLPAGLTLHTNGTIAGMPTRAGTYPVTISVDDSVLKSYRIVIETPAAPSSSPSTVSPTSAAPTTASPSSSTPHLSVTGTNVRPLASYAIGALVLGSVLAGIGHRRRGGRHRY